MLTHDDNRMKEKTRDRSRAFLRLASLAGVILFSIFSFQLSVPSVSAQDDPSDGVPPPEKQISKDERAHLDAESEPKLRVILELRMMSDRLTTAEKENSGRNYDGVYTELGGFHYLMEDALAFLEKHDATDKKLLDYYKRYEIGLRAFVPRVEILRREMPTEYEPYVGHLLKHIRDVREKCLDPMFSDTVIPVVNKKPL